MSLSKMTAAMGARFGCVPIHMYSTVIPSREIITPSSLPVVIPTTHNSIPSREYPEKVKEQLRLRKRIAARTRIAEIDSKKLPSNEPYTDTHNRKHTYLRISLTDRCNLSCKYCMPPGLKYEPDHNKKFVTNEEILRIVTLFAARGVDKIRLTGGEPTLRKDLVQLVEKISKVEGIKDIGITSNGVVLGKNLIQLKEAGLNKINLSLDTLVQEKYAQMSGLNAFKKVWKCIDKAEELFGKVKINTVVLRDFNDVEIPDFVELTRNRNLDVRFIEFMPFHGNDFKAKNFVPYDEMIKSIHGRFGVENVKRLSDSTHGTTKAFKVDNHTGQFGFITSMSDHFCGTCNRLRLTADGKLKVCLHGSSEVSLKNAMRVGASDIQLDKMIAQAVRDKSAHHAGMETLAAPNQSSRNRPMVSIGG